MTAGPPTTPTGLAIIARNPYLLWGAFSVTHLILGLINLYGYGYPLGDVTSVYRFWTDQALAADYWVAIDQPWVYPVVAIVPMLIPQLAYPILDSLPGVAVYGAGVYASGWLSMIMVLNVVALGVLTGGRKRIDRLAAGWWWVAFLLMLGPISLGRIDSVTVPLAIVGVLFISSRPRLATVLLTVGAWIKVWPGAIVIAVVVATRDRWRVLLAAVGTSIGIVALALSYGSGANVLSFVTQQTGRGLQVEAPVSTPWMWLAYAGVPGSSVYYDEDILTWQVTGAGVDVASALMTPLLLLGVAVIVAVGLLAVRRGASAGAILPPLVLALLAGLIAFQKVGSPQFISWLAVPVIYGLVSRGQSVRFRTPAALVLVLAAMTHVIYPYLYGYLLGLFPAMLVVLTVRNALLFVLLGWAIAAVARAPRWTTDAALRDTTWHSGIRRT